MRIRPRTSITIIAAAVLAATLSAQTRLVPIAEGWAKNQVNAVIFRKNSVTSFNGNQFAAFYDADSKVVLAKRRLGETKWEIRPTQFTGNTNDAHNSISIAIDGRSFTDIMTDISYGYPQSKSALLSCTKGRHQPHQTNSKTQ